MAVDFSKILDHPNKDEIISKLMTGVNPKDVGDWLKLKYSNPDQSHLRLNSTLLKAFSEGSLDLYSQMKNDLNNIKNDKAIEKKVSQSLLNNKTYRERLNELADEEINIKTVLKETVFIIRARIEQMFDAIQENPKNFRPDNTIIRYFDTLLNASEKFNKIVNEAPDQVIQHNITVQMIEDHSAVLQDAVRETMAELDPEIAFLFIEKLNEKMLRLKPEQEVVQTQEKRLLEAKFVKDKIEEEM